MTVFLCGFMGCGKTTIGALLAKKLGVQLIDTDARIVEKEGLSIPEIFAQKGEGYFREIEAQTVRELAGKKAVVSCGGGAMLRDDTAAAAREKGCVVFLDVPFETCYARIRGDKNRPLVQQNSKEGLQEIFDARRGVYLQNASVVVSADKAPLEVAETIFRGI